jgi:hypothetical protein
VKPLIQPQSYAEADERRADSVRSKIETMVFHPAGPKEAL